MTDRKHCTDCELDYTDEASHQLVHQVVAAAQTLEPASSELAEPAG